MLNFGQDFFKNRRESIYDPQNYLTNPVDDLEVHRSLKVIGEGITATWDTPIMQIYGEAALLENTTLYRKYFYHDVHLMHKTIFSWNAATSALSDEVSVLTHGSIVFAEWNGGTEAYSSPLWTLGRTGTDDFMIRDVGGGTSATSILYVYPFTSFYKKITSTLATGTKPLEVTSTTMCDNLNADMVDSYHFTGASGSVTADAAELNKVDGYTGTAANLNTLTDDSMADALHRHSELSASDGTPNPALSVDATGNVSVLGGILKADHIAEYTGSHNIVFDNKLSTGSQIISTLATGTKPIDVTSTTVCTNLNADTVDAAHLDDIERIIFPTSAKGTNGMVDAFPFGYVQQVAFSDTDARYWATFYVRRGGSFKAKMGWYPDAANTSKTMSGVFYANAAVTAGVIGWVGDYGGNWDIAIPNTAHTYTQSTYGTALTISNDSYVSVLFAKDDNAGGASGNLNITEMVLVRQ